MKPIQIIKKFFIPLLLVFLFTPIASADETISVNFFYGITCPHCKKVDPFIEELRPKYPEVTFNKYEVYRNKVNSSRLNTYFDNYDVPSNQRGVPALFVGDQYFIGDTPIIDNLENAIETILSASEVVTPHEPKITIEESSDPVVDPAADPVITTPEKPPLQPEEVSDGRGSSKAEEMEEVEDQPKEEIAPESTTHNQYWWLIALAGFLVVGFYLKNKSTLTDRQKDYVTVTISIIALIGFFIVAKNISPELLEEVGYNLPLPIFTFLIALVDGFNPCNLFVLTFLLALLTSASHSKKRIYVVGFSFVFMVFLIYLLFMAAWLNIFKYIGFIDPLRIGIALLALIAGVINCKELLFFRKGITLMVQEQHKGLLVKRIEHMKEVIKKGAMPVLISSSIALAAFASLVELPCTAGFPIIYTGILSAKSLMGMSYYGYLVLYNLIYVLPLAVIILIFGYTFEGKKISPRQMGVIKFVGGLIMILLGIILLVNPGMIGIVG